MCISVWGFIHMGNGVLGGPAAYILWELDGQAADWWRLWDLKSGPQEEQYVLLTQSHFSLFDFCSEFERLLKFKGSPIAQPMRILPFVSMDKMLIFNQWYSEGSYICLRSSIWGINYDVIISNTEARWLSGTCSRSIVDTHPLLSWLRSTAHFSCVGQVICSCMKCRSGDLLCMKWAAFWICFPTTTCFSWRIFMIVFGKSIQIFTWISTSLLMNQYLPHPAGLYFAFFKMKKDFFI